jgi:hypothetical protein
MIVIVEYGYKLDGLCSYPYIAAEINIQNQLPSKEFPYLVDISWAKVAGACS